MKTVKAILFYLIEFTWAVTQNLVGFIGFVIMRIKGCKHEKFNNAFITYVHAKNFGGVSLGLFIFINADITGDRLHDIQIHEFGHSIQSAILGPVWWLIIAIPSFIWCGLPVLVNYRKKHNVSYYRLYCEGWSNLCGLWATKDRFLTAECLERGRYGGPIYPNRNPRKDIKGRKRNK